MLAPEGNHVKIIALCAVTSILSNFLEGYSSAYPNTADDTFEHFLNNSFADRSADHAGLSMWAYTFFWSLFLNVWFIGFLTGTSLTPYVADTYGRKGSYWHTIVAIRGTMGVLVAIIFANAINFIATVLSVGAVLLKMPELLIAGRIFGAAGSGIAMNGLIIFIQETSPTALRGTCSFLSEGTFIAANVIGMGMGMDVALGKNLIALIGLAAIPNLFGMLIMLPLKESPKYLLINRNDRKAALESLIYYQGKDVKHNDILEEMLKESDNNRIDLPFMQAIREVFSQPYLRRAMIIGVLSLQIIVGIWPIIYNSTELLEAHMSPKQAQFSSFLFIVANFLASIVGMWAVERAGRRPMLIYCGIWNTLSLCIFIACERLAAHVAPIFKWGQVAGLVGYGITYGVAVGPIAAFITTELVPQRFRSLVQSLVYGVNTVIIFFLSFITLPLYHLITVWAFIPLFIVPSTLALIYLAFEMPETRGREIHEIVEQLIRDSTVGKKGKGIDPDILPDVLPRTNSALGRLRDSLRKISNKVGGGNNHSVVVPRIVIKSESNATLKTLTAAAMKGEGLSNGICSHHSSQKKVGPADAVATLPKSVEGIAEKNKKERVKSKGRFTSITKVELKDQEV